MNTIGQDIRYALRTMRRNPGFALAVVLTLALGIGANVTMFSVVDALLFRMPAHVRAPEQIVNLDVIGNNGRLENVFHTFPGYTRLADNIHSVDLAAMTHPWAIDFGRGPGAREISASYVTSSYFDVVGVHLLVGRPFTKAEDNPAGGIPVAVLGYDFWRALGEDPHILNQAVWIGDGQFTVIGIAPRGFNGLDSSRVDVWLPISDVPSSPESSLLTSERSLWLDTIGRLKAGVPRGRGEAEVTAAFVHGGGKLDGKVRLTPYYEGRTQKLSQSARVSLWLVGVAFAVLLIACANVVNLFLVRMVQRKHEMAIRLQLGASRGRLAGQMLVESLLLSFAGGGTALLVSYWIRPLIGVVLFTKYFYVGNLLNWRVLTFSLLLVAPTGLFVGLLAARRAVRQDLSFALKSGSQGKSRERSALRSGLLVTQVALTLVLSIGAGLFLASLRHAHMFDQGFETHRVLFVSMNLHTSGMKPEEINAVYRRLAERANGAPRVERTTIVASFALIIREFSLVKDPSKKGMAMVGIEQVAPGYFETLGIRILRGRSFLPTDRFGSPPVAIVNETLASDLWHTENPIGKCLAVASSQMECHTIVGVVPDQLKSLAAGRTISRKTTAGNTSDAYFPLEQSVSKDLDSPATGLLIRTSGDASAAVHDISEALAGLAPEGRYVTVLPFSELMDPQIRPFRLGASMFSFFGGLALLLAAVGIYGVLAFLVRHRTSEIGIRMALGAMPQDILRLIVWQGMKFVGLGLAIGIGAALGLSRVVRSLLFEVTPTDVWSYAGASVVLIVVALAACMVPAWRAARVDPSISLRYE